MLARRSLRILVVDDEEPILSFASRVLQDAGHEVSTAFSGAQALRVIAAQPAFDVFVLDVMMPGMRGDELARQIAQTDPDAKVLYLTGYADRLFQEKSVLWEHEAFLEKAVTGNALLEAIALLASGHTERRL